MPPGLAPPYPWWRREIKTLLTHPGEPRGVPWNTRQLTRPARPPPTSHSPAQPGPNSGIPGLAPSSLAAAAPNPACSPAGHSPPRLTRRQSVDAPVARRFLTSTSCSADTPSLTVPRYQCEHCLIILLTYELRLETRTSTSSPYLNDYLSICAKSSSRLIHLRESLPVVILGAPAPPQWIRLSPALL